MKVIIVGGVAGGATAAARLRRLDETAEIVVFERSGYVSYANCGLPYYIGGVITDKEELTLQTPESFWQRFRVGETPLFVYCLSGVRSRQAAGLLRRMGYTDVTDLGGICNYRGKVVK